METSAHSGFTELATFGGGCFWCTEAIFHRLMGVQAVTSGYAGGQVKNPTYAQVSRGTTGHAEAIQIEFDPREIPYEKLLDVFWGTHDPTTPNQQGADVGPEYRSVIFTHTPEQAAIAEKMRDTLDASGRFHDPIVTEIVPFSSFSPAEDYHQDYYEKNPSAAYCQLVIDPKLRKLKKDFGDRLKEDQV